MIRGSLIAGVAVWLVTVVAAGAPANEPPETLLDTSPAVGAVVVRVPTEVSLTFAEPVRSVRIRVFKGGVLATDTSAQIEGTLAVAPAPSEGPGQYLVDWKGSSVAGAPLTGAYVFTVDPRGSESAAVHREVTGAGGTLGGLRVAAAFVAAAGTVALLVGARRIHSQTPPRDGEHRLGIAATATAIGGLMAALTYGLPADASTPDLIGLGVVPSAATSIPGRAWFAATLTMGSVPFVLVAHRATRSRWASAAALGVSAAALFWVALGLGWLVRAPWPLTALAMAMAALAWTGVASGRPMLALGGLLVASAIAVPVIVDLRGSGASATAQTGDLLIEMSADPATSGFNEMHLYGFDIAGGTAVLGPTSVGAVHPAANVGPLAVSLLRAGPNHFLSYRADLPLPGVWTFRISTTRAVGTVETATLEMEFG